MTDAYPLAWPTGWKRTPSYNRKRATFGAQEIAKPGAAGGNGDEGAEGKLSRSGKRVKFTCPGCEANAWGKATLALICGLCQEPFESDEAE
jgi:hypothetical protein